MKVYILRNVPDDLWRTISAQARLNGQTIREYLITLMAQSTQIEPTGELDREAQG